jgi:hypothetical protein
MPKMMKQLDLGGFTGNPMVGYVWTNLLAGNVKCIQMQAFLEQLEESLEGSMTSERLQHLIRQMHQEKMKIRTVALAALKTNSHLVAAAILHQIVLLQRQLCEAWHVWK